MITSDGRAVYPDAGQPSLESVALGLARTCRFAGQTKKWYSVLAHTFVVAAIVPEEYKLHALLHDAAEAILGDRVSSWKDSTTAMYERMLIGRICFELGIENTFENPYAVKAVKKADKIALSAEAMILDHADFNHDDFRVDFDTWEYERAFQLTTRQAEVSVLDWIDGKFNEIYIDQVHNEVAKCLVRN